MLIRFEFLKQLFYLHIRRHHCHYLRRNQQASNSFMPTKDQRNTATEANREKKTKMLFQTMQKSVVILKKCLKLGFKNKTFLVKLEHKGYKFVKFHLYI